MSNLIKTAVYITEISSTVQFEIMYINESASDDIEDTVRKFMPKKSYTPTKGDKIYFVPGCTVPRFKVKDFCEKFDVALVKNPERATARFVGTEGFKSLFRRTNNNYWYSKDVILQTLRNPKYEIVCKAIAESSSNFVLIDYRAVNFIKANQNFNAKEMNYRTAPNVRFQNEEAYQKFINITSEENLYNQDEVLRRINTGNVMTKEDYVAIKRLLKSSDMENVKVAIETMSNCDYEKSCVHLLLLIHEFGGTLYNAPTKNHVNFKSLLKFFGITNLGNFRLDDIITTLLEQKLLSKANLDILLPLAMQQMSNTDYFSVKEITPSKEILRGLEENILDADCNTEIIEEPIEQINPRF